MEAALASAVIAAAIVFKIQIETRQAYTEDIKDLAAAIVKVPYAIDKRVLLDGHTLPSSASFTGAQDTFQNMLIHNLVGTTSSACAGGWDASDPANKALNLIPCKLFNYAKMPFGFQMDGKYSVDPSSRQLQSFYVEFYHASQADFDKNLEAYSKLTHYSRVMSEPQITGSHKFYLANRATGQELTPNECRNAGTQCAFRAEYFTNHTGLGEDVYLRVNGGNYMLGNIYWKGTFGAAPVECKSVDAAGNLITTPCGIQLDTGAEDVNIAADKIAGTSVSVNGELYTISTSGKTFKVEANTGNTNIKGTLHVNQSATIDGAATLHNNLQVGGQTTLHSSLLVGGATTMNNTLSVGGGATMRQHLDVHGATSLKNTLTVDGETKLNNTATIEGLATLRKGINVADGAFTFSVKSDGITSRNAAGDGLTIQNGSGTHFTGKTPTVQNLDIFNRNSDSSAHFAAELVSKGYLHSFHQIVGIDTVASGVTTNLYRCPNNQLAEVVGFPAKAMLVSSQAQQERVCPYAFGQRLPNITPTLELSMVPGGQGTVVGGEIGLSYVVNCKWEGDYAQVWYMNRNGSTFTPRFYLLSPKDVNGATTNFEVEMDFLTIQYCLPNKLNTDGKPTGH